MEALIHQLQQFDYARHGDAARVFNGRGQCYPGLEHINVDWFEPLLLVTLYREPDEEQYRQLYAGLHSLPVAVETILVQSRWLHDLPVQVVRGQLPAEATAREGDWRFSLRFGGRQNIGYFMDMSPGRDWCRQVCAGKRVLNLFAYTGAFSVVALGAGAERVVNVDMSKASLAQARDNHVLNGQRNTARRRVEMLPHNIFKSWKRIVSRGPYDIVIIDPPSRQPGSFVAEADYGRVLKRLPSLLAAGGDILACLNAPHLAEDFLHRQFADHCPGAVFVGRLPNREDFPESDTRRNVKILHYRLANTST